MGDLQPLVLAEDIQRVKSLMQRHVKYTGSDLARRLLLNWDISTRKAFKKVYPKEYK